MKTRTFLIAIGMLALLAFQKPIDYVDLDKDVVNAPRQEETPFRVGERISYRLHYGIMNAGVADLYVLPHDTLIDDRQVYHMKGVGRTISVFEWFYKVYDVYETYLDREHLKPRKFKRRVNEGGYIINRDYHFQPEYGKVNTLRKGEINTPSDVQDMLSSFYYLRSLDFTKAREGDVFLINAFMDYEMWPFYVKFKGRDVIEVDAGRFDCYKFVPIVQEGRVFKAEEDLEVWVTADKNKVPIMAKANILVGSVKMELTGYDNLAHPVAKLVKQKGLFDWF